MKHFNKQIKFNKKFILKRVRFDNNGKDDGEILLIKYNIVSIAIVEAQDYWEHLERERHSAGARGDPGEFRLFLSDAGSLAGLVPIYRTSGSRVRQSRDQRVT